MMMGVFKAKMFGRLLVALLGLLFAAWIAVIVNFHNIAIHIDRGMDHIESMRKKPLDIISLSGHKENAATPQSQDAQW